MVKLLKKYPKHYLSLFLVLLFLVSFLLRVVSLSSYPVGFHFDEAVAGYNAYSLLETGKSVKNGPWPLYLNTFGDYRPMGVVYLMMPSIAAFGLTEFAVRLPIALIGSVSPLLLFILVRLYSKKISLAVLASVFLTLSPWHITLSRATSEAILAVFLAMVIMYFAYLLKESGKLQWGGAMYFFMLISYVSYHPINLFLVFIIPIFAIIYWKDLLQQKSSRMLLLGVFIVYLIFPFFTGILFSNSTGRLSQVVNIFGGEAKKHLQIQYIQEGMNSNVLLSRMFHNKVINPTLDLSERYVSYFSPEFLFFKGGLPKRYITPDVGLIGVIELLGLVIFLISLVSIEKKKPLLFFLAWLLIGVLPAAITTDDTPNVSRAVLMLPALQVLAGYGVLEVTKIKSRKLLVWFLLVIAAVSVWHYLYFFHQYVVHERYTQWLERSYPAKETVEKMSHLDRHKKVLVSTTFLGTDAFVLFYEKVDPSVAQKAYAEQGTRLKKLYNYTFVDSECPSQQYPVGYDYFVEHYWCIEPKEFPVTPIYGADGLKILKVVETMELQK